MMAWHTILPFLLHPVIFYLLEQLMITLILGFTSADSILRPAFLPLLVACVWKVISICLERIHRIPWAAFAGGVIICNLLGYVESALISKWTFEAQGPTSSAGPEPLQATHANRNNRGSFWERCRFGYLATTSSRNIGTPYVHLLFPLTTPITSPHAPRFSIEKQSSSFSPF